MAKGKLIDKCRNILYKSNDKSYVRKRKCASETSSDELDCETSSETFDEGKTKNTRDEIHYCITHI